MKVGLDLHQSGVALGLHDGLVRFVLSLEFDLGGKVEVHLLFYSFWVFGGFERLLSLLKSSVVLGQLGHQLFTL